MMTASTSSSMGDSDGSSSYSTTIAAPGPPPPPPAPLPLPLPPPPPAPAPAPAPAPPPPFPFPWTFTEAMVCTAVRCSLSLQPLQPRQSRPPLWAVVCSVVLWCCAAHADGPPHTTRAPATNHPHTARLTPCPCLACTAAPAPVTPAPAPPLVLATSLLALKSCSRVGGGRRDFGPCGAARMVRGGAIFWRHHIITRNAHQTRLLNRADTINAHTHTHTTAGGDATRHGTGRHRRAGVGSQAARGCGGCGAPEVCVRARDR